MFSITCQILKTKGNKKIVIHNANLKINAQGENESIHSIKSSKA